MAKVTVYTKPQCVQCDQTKKYLDRNGIEYAVVDLMEDADALKEVTAMGFASAPVVVTDTDQWSGFKLHKLVDLVEASK